MEEDPDVILNSPMKWVPLSITAEYPEGLKHMILQFHLKFALSIYKRWYYG